MNDIWRHYKDSGILDAHGNPIPLSGSPGAGHSPGWGHTEIREDPHPGREREFNDGAPPPWMQRLAFGLAVTAILAVVFLVAQSIL